jgi:hypothetical protein
MTISLNSAVGTYLMLYIREVKLSMFGPDVAYTDGWFPLPPFVSPDKCWDSTIKQDTIATPSLYDRIEYAAGMVTSPKTVILHKCYFNL